MIPDKEDINLLEEVLTISVIITLTDLLNPHKKEKETKGFKRVSAYQNTYTSIHRQKLDFSVFIRYPRKLNLLYNSTTVTITPIGANIKNWHNVPRTNLRL